MAKDAEILRLLDFGNGRYHLDCAVSCYGLRLTGSSANTIATAGELFLEFVGCFVHLSKGQGCRLLVGSGCVFP